MDDLTFDKFHQQRINDRLLTIPELKDIRHKFQLSYERCDSLFGLAYGSYELFETCEKCQSIMEDMFIRATYIIDKNGNNILPKWN